LGLGLLRLLPKSGRTPAGEILYRRRDGRVVDVLRFSNEEMRRFRWQECAMVFQAAQSALNRVARVWDQMLDTVRAHLSDSRDKIRERCERLLGMVQLEPRRVLHAFPHELSRMSVYLSLFFAQFSDALEFVLRVAGLHAHWRLDALDRVQQIPRGQLLVSAHVLLAERHL